MRRVIPERLGLSRADAAGVGACLVASLVFYGAGAQPFLQRQRAAAEQRWELKVGQDKAAELRAAVSKARERLAVVQAERAAGTIGLASATQVNGRLAALTALFAGRHLEIHDVQTGRMSSGTRYNLVPIMITGRGAYGSFLDFFAELRSTFPDMSVVRIELTKQPKQTAGPVTFQFDLLWCAAPDRSAGPAAPNGTRRVALGR